MDRKIIVGKRERAVNFPENRPVIFKIDEERYFEINFCSEKSKIEVRSGGMGSSLKIEPGCANVIFLEA